MMSPLMKRRWQAFKANRRGYWSLWVFLSLLVFSSFTDWIANDQPVIVHYEGKTYFPILSFVSDIELGGDLLIACDFTHPDTVTRIKKQGWMVWPLVPYRYDTVDTFNPEPAPSPPSKHHWLGTDDQGRDVVARLLYGFRVSCYFGLLMTVFSVTIGILLGAVQGYFGGWVDLLLQRFTEIWSGLPVLYLLMLLSSFVPLGFWGILLVMTLLSWMGLANLVRAEFLRTRHLEYVRAAQVLGVPTFTIMIRHVLPNAMIAVITFLPFILNGGISMLTSFQFLGVGIPTGMASMGELLLQGKNNLYAPWLGITSFVSMTLLLSVLIFIGEAIRDAFDPRKLVTNAVRTI